MSMSIETGLGSGEDPAPPPKSTAGRAIVRALQYLCAIALFLIVVVTFFDVLGRYFFNRPIPGASEYIQFLMAITIFAGLPLITGEREHISVSLADHVQGTLRRIKLVVVDLTSLVAIMLITWQLFEQAGDYAEIGTSSIVLKLPMAPLAAAMGVLACLTAGVLLVMLWQDLTAENPT